MDSQKSLKPKVLAKATHTFLRCVNVIDFDEQASHDYGQFCRSKELLGKNLQPMDLLIACHAHILGAVLVTADNAIARLKACRLKIGRLHHKS